MRKSNRSTPGQFEELVTKAMDALQEALKLRDADGLWLNVRRNRADADLELFFEERELAGKVGANGAVTFGRKP